MLNDFKKYVSRNSDKAVNRVVEYFNFAQYVLFKPVLGYVHDEAK